MNLLCRLLVHSWRVTHQNRYGIDTRQVCNRCSAVREWRGGPPFIGGRWHEIEERKDER